MSVMKLSVSIDEDIGEVVKAAAREEGVSVSAWLTDAAAARIRNHLLAEAVAEAIGEVPGYDDAMRNELVTQARSTTIYVGSESNPSH